MYAEMMANKALEAGDMRGFNYWTSIKKTVDAAPPLAPEIRDRLTVLLRIPA